MIKVLLCFLQGGIPYYSSGVFSKEEEIAQIPQRVYAFLMQVWHVWRERSIDICQPAENDSTCDSSCNVVVTNAVEKTCISTERVGDNKVSSLEKTYAGIKANMEEQDGKIDTKYLSRISTSTIKVHPDMKSSSSVVICSSANGCSLKMSSSCCCS
ncbi:hypothetical protein V6N13_063740 [Hibiscus sabdariffa]